MPSILNLQTGADTYIRLEPQHSCVLLTEILHPKDTSEFTYIGQLRVPNEQVFNLANFLLAVTDELKKRNL